MIFWGLWAVVSLIFVLQYFDLSETRHNQAKISLAGQHYRPLSKNYFEP